MSIMGFLWIPSGRFLPDQSLLLLLKCDRCAAMSDALNPAPRCCCTGVREISLTKVRSQSSHAADSPTTVKTREGSSVLTESLETNPADDSVVIFSFDGLDIVLFHPQVIRAVYQKESCEKYSSPCGQAPVFTGRPSTREFSRVERKGN